MKKEVALQVYNFNLKPIEDYVLDRIQDIYKQMEFCTQEEFYNCQGRIAELRKILNIRQTAQNILENYNGRGNQESNSANR